MMQINQKYMTPEQFCYWLQGFNEIRDSEKVGLTEKEWDIIKDHLKIVFDKQTPPYVTTISTPPLATPQDIPLYPGSSAPEFIC